MKRCPVEFWIWLQTALGAGARTDEILAYFETPEELYLAGSREWRLSGLFTEKKITALGSTSPSETGRILRECHDKGYDIITPDSPYYPNRLKNLRDTPLVLYCMGDASVLSQELSIGMVGTRRASEYGVHTAQKLSYQLAEAGALIVSGGALGIDSEAHAGAMLAKGKTVAFLGCGLSFDYLRENASLRRAIARHGAVVSEYQPFTPASRTTFPIRNRLISGLSLGIVVVEAGVKSGSLITAERALEQGRDVFAVPGDIIRSSFDGTNHLIQRGVKPVFSAADILCEYEYLYGDLFNIENISSDISKMEYVDYRNYKKSQTAPSRDDRAQSVKAEPTKAEPVIKKELPDGVSDEARLVYSAIGSEPVHVDDIVRKTDLKMNIVLSSLTELELFGCVESMNGKKYKSL